MIKHGRNKRENVCSITVSIIPINVTVKSVSLGITDMTWRLLCQKLISEYCCSLHRRFCVAVYFKKLRKQDNASMLEVWCTFHH